MEEGRNVLLLPAQRSCQTPLQCSCTRLEDACETRETCVSPAAATGTRLPQQADAKRLLVIMFFIFMQNQVLALQDVADPRGLGFDHPRPRKSANR